MLRRWLVTLLAGLPLLAVPMPSGAERSSQGLPALDPAGDGRRTAVPLTQHSCPALPDPSGNVVHLYPDDVSTMRGTIYNASPGDTFLLHDGTYDIPYGDYIFIRTDGVTLRSASGDRESVVIDGHYNDGTYGRDLLTVAASEVTIADLTIKRSYDHPIHIYPYWTDTKDVTDTLIYNVQIVDPGQQAIKINPASGHYVDDGVVACSRIELTDEGRSHIRGGCYTGGVDGHQAWGWRIRDNVIQGFWCPNGLSEHAIHFWTGSRDTVVERNVLINNARGVGFGLGRVDGGRSYDPDPCPVAEETVGHYGGVIRNNLVFADRAELFASVSGFDSGISINQACGVQVLHNTVGSTQAPSTVNQGSIEYRFQNTTATIDNNLVTHNIVARDEASATLAGNWTGMLAVAPATFFDWAAGDLHLAATAGGAINQGVAAGVMDDVDGDIRDASPDVGADEYMSPLWRSEKRVSPMRAAVGEILTYTLLIRNSSDRAVTGCELTDPIPLGATYVPGSAQATSGIVEQADGIAWSGTVIDDGVVTISFNVTATTSSPLVNVAVVSDTNGLTQTLVAVANGATCYLPLLLRER